MAVLVGASLPACSGGSVARDEAARRLDRVEADAGLALVVPGATLVASERHECLDSTPPRFQRRYRLAGPETAVRDFYARRLPEHGWRPEDSAGERFLAFGKDFGDWTARAVVGVSPPDVVVLADVAAAPSAGCG